MATPAVLAAFFDANPAYFYAFLLGLGLLVGSFLNVVILRLPQMMHTAWECDCRALLGIEDRPSRAQNVEDTNDIEIPRTDDAEPSETQVLSLSYPGSHCPQCKAPIRAWQNVPVISYLLLRGRCANCSQSIPWRYPFVEAFTALATLLVGYACGPGIETLAYVLLTWCLVALAGIDIDTQLLPDDITQPLLWAGIVFNFTLGPVSLQDAVIGAIAGYGVLWSVYWIFKLATGKEGMGFGDFKLLAALGAWLGWQAVPIIILLSSLVGAVLGIIIITLRRQGRSQPLPFGPYLAAAGFLCVVWGDHLRALILGGL